MLNHTPHPWYIEHLKPLDTGANAQIVHGTYLVAEGYKLDDRKAKWSDDPVACANGQLLSLATVAPHDCADPRCPGHLNKRRLDLWPHLVAALDELIAEHDDRNAQLRRVEHGTLGYLDTGGIAVARTVLERARAIDATP
jgi:hypothetical protein